MKNKQYPLYKCIHIYIYIYYYNCYQRQQVSRVPARICTRIKEHSEANKPSKSFTATTTVWPVQNKHFRSQRLERRMAQTHRSKKTPELRRRPFGQSGIKSFAANGWSGDWLRPTQEQENARTAATAWPVRIKGSCNQRLERSLAPSPRRGKKAPGLRRPLGQCGLKASAANGWSGEWPKTHTGARKHQDCDDDRLASAELRDPQQTFRQCSECMQSWCR